MSGVNEQKNSENAYQYIVLINGSILLQEEVS